ncbi:MAG TPA: hypothetical protein VNA25_17640 [Phycisphaerae bacterium]|nr:hypothetical protein [Phycisphaerae bacterium]
MGISKPRTRRLVLVGVGVFLLAGAILPPALEALAWTHFWVREELLDIKTGRVRYTRYLLYCKIGDRTEDSVISKALPADLVKSAAPEWHTVNAFSPGVSNSPHYGYHGALCDILLIEEAWCTAKFSDAAKRKAAENLLLLWQESGGESPAGEYADAVANLAQKLKAMQKPGEVSDLPPLPVVQPRPRGASAACTLNAEP